MFLLTSLRNNVYMSSLHDFRRRARMRDPMLSRCSSQSSKVAACCLPMGKKLLDATILQSIMYSTRKTNWLPCLRKKCVNTEKLHCQCNCPANQSQVLINCSQFPFHPCHLMNMSSSWTTAVVSSHWTKQSRISADIKSISKHKMHFAN